MEAAMMSLQEISDRLEIQDLFARYSFAIDERDWDALDALFTYNAVIDYSGSGGIRGSVAEIKRWLPVALARFPRYQPWWRRPNFSSTAIAPRAARFCSTRWFTATRTALKRPSSSACGTATSCYGFLARLAA